MLTVVMLTVVMLTVIMLTVTMLTVVMLTVVMLGVLYAEFCDKVHYAECPEAVFLVVCNPSVNEL
jgi:hypothetical protein